MKKEILEEEAINKAYLLSLSMQLESKLAIFIKVDSGRPLAVGGSYSTREHIINVIENKGKRSIIKIMQVCDSLTNSSGKEAMKINLLTYNLLTKLVGDQVTYSKVMAGTLSANGVDLTYKGCAKITDSYDVLQMISTIYKKSGR